MEILATILSTITGPFEDCHPCRRRGPVAPEGADWMHFNNPWAALRYMHSPNGRALTKLAHTEVMRAAKTDGTRDGWAFTMWKPLSSSSAPAAPPPSSSRATPSRSPSFLVSIRCACCGANISGTNYSCQSCHKVIDGVCMTTVGSSVHCFVCTCCAYGRQVSTLNVECHKCHFCMHPGCTTHGICTSCAERRWLSNPPPPQK